MATARPSAVLCPSPLSLYPADNPGNVLVTKLRDEDNYSSWTRAMRVALGAKNKYVFVDGSLPRPDPKVDKDGAGAWDQCDLMVTSWIYNSLKPELQQTVLYANSSRELWLDLERRYAQSNGPRIFDLKRRINLLRQDHLSVSGYFAALKVLWDELGSHIQHPQYSTEVLIVLAEHMESDQLYQFLMGFNDTFATIRTQILAMDPLPSCIKAYSMVLQDERHRGLSVSVVPTDNTACAVGRPQDFRRKFQMCSYCHRQGHLKEIFFSLNGFPPNFGRRNFKPNGSDPKRFQAHNAISAGEISSDSTDVLTGAQGPSSGEGLGNQDGDWTGPAA